MLIKNMKMPKNCSECKLLCNESFEMWCCLTDREDVFLDATPDWCPLVELPEKHGRLVEFIDVATEINEDTGLEEVNLGEAFCAYFKMRESKPVIEAEDEG